MWLNFLYIILFISLYLSAISLGGILHYAADSFFPTKLGTTNSIVTPDDSFLGLFLAALIVSFPIFLFILLTLKKRSLVGLGAGKSRARTVLAYITFGATFLILAGQLIAAFHNLIGGIATIKTFIDLGVTFLVAGPIFLYLLNEARKEQISS